MSALERVSVAPAESQDLAPTLVEQACRAPSVHNTQPWRWGVDGPRIELRADRERQLRVSDPTGRNLTISCGAALHHLQVAAAGLGRTTDVARFPNPDDPDLLAVVELGPEVPVTPADAESAVALEHRLTDRRRFTSWPVPEERLDRLASFTERWGTGILALTGGSARSTVEQLVDRALEAQQADPRFATEQREWIGGSRDDGVPLVVLPSQEHVDERRDRFERTVDPGVSRVAVERSDGVLAICSARDDASAWLDAGETLSALWLRATLAGLSLVPLSQVIEVEATRVALRRDVFFDMAQPQLLVRIGWQEMGRSPLPRTRRRSLGDVLHRVGQG